MQSAGGVLSLNQVLTQLEAQEKSTNRLYQNSLKAFFQPSLRSLITSIIDQKSKKIERIHAFIDGEGLTHPQERYPSLALHASNLEFMDQAEFLKVLIKGEDELRQAYLGIVGLMDEGEARAFLQTLAEESRKHAAWAQDRLDLEFLRT